MKKRKIVLASGLIKFLQRYSYEKVKKGKQICRWQWNSTLFFLVDLPLSITYLTENSDCQVNSSRGGQIGLSMVNPLFPASVKDSQIYGGRPGIWLLSPASDHTSVRDIMQRYMSQWCLCSYASLTMIVIPIQLEALLVVHDPSYPSSFCN